MFLIQKKPMAVLRNLLIGLMLIVLFACGGSGGTPTAIKAQAIVDWPALTKGLTGPSYAASASFSLTMAGVIPPYAWTGDRPAGTAAVSTTYPGPDMIAAGPGTLVVEFKSGAGGTGTTVASATVNVQIAADGTVFNASGGPLGSVAYNTALTGIELTAPDTTIGSTVTLVANGVSPGGVVALPQALVDFSIVGTSTVATLNGALLTGATEGTLTLQASFETFTDTDDSTVTIGELAFTRVAFPARGLAVDHANNKIWGTFGSSNVAYANSIVDVDLATGAIGTPIPVGSEPESIGISPDGTVAYVGLNGTMKIRKVDLTTRTAGVTLDYVQLDANTVPVDIQVNPTNFGEIVMGVRSNVNGVRRGPYVVRDDNTAIAATTLTDACLTVLWDTGTTVIRGMSGGSGMVSRYTVGATTVTFGDSVTHNQVMHAHLRPTNGNRLVEGHGKVYSTVDLSLVGAVTGSGMLSTESDLTSNKIWAAVGGSTNPLTINTYDSNTFALQLIHTIPMNGENMGDIYRVGATGFVASSNQALYLVQTAPGL
ncbi:MAG TPA: hypothetical protein VK171_12320 [Fimbriimonas sp.]|nr:hypothetical protein [Fimbriimonas sp.]